MIILQEKKRRRSNALTNTNYSLNSFNLLTTFLFAALVPQLNLNFSISNWAFRLCDYFAIDAL